MWDAIVVGAGPAGIAAAMAIHRAGGRVALLDRHDFPRPKACAGMLSAHALRHCPFPPAPVLVAVPQLVAVREGGREQGLPERNYLAHRIELDAFLQQQAVAAGVPFFRIPGLAKLQQGESSVRLTTPDRRLFTARTVIGADGANSQVRRLLGLDAANRDAFALELDVEWTPGSDTPLLDFDAVPGGYGWIFPKGERCNIGIARMASGGAKGSGEELSRYLARGIPPAAGGPVRGAAIGAFGRHTHLGTGRILLCGDAASLADPWTGEGISHAFVSGRLAGSAALAAPAAPLATYRTAMQPTLRQLERRQAKKMATYGVATFD